MLSIFLFCYNIIVQNKNNYIMFRAKACFVQKKTCNNCAQDIFAKDQIKTHCKIKI